MFYSWLTTLLMDVLPSLLAGAIMATLAVLFTRRKTRMEIRNMRLEVQLEATEQANAIAVGLERYKAEQARALEVVATQLVQTIQEERSALAILASQLTHAVTGIDALAIVLARMEATHQVQVKLFAARAQSSAAIVVLQEAKALTAKDLTAARAEIEVLYAQVADLQADKEPA